VLQKSLYEQPAHPGAANAFRHHQFANLATCSSVIQVRERHEGQHASHATVMLRNQGAAFGVSDKGSDSFFAHPAGLTQVVSQLANQGDNCGRIG
jgi:hypothetical protein